MSKLQELFDRIQESKKEQKELKLIYRDALAHNQDFQSVEEELKGLKDSKKKIEDEIKEDFTSEFNKLDTLKLDIENDSLLMNDVALTMLTKGETVEVVDEKGNKCNPFFSVKFKKN